MKFRELLDSYKNNEDGNFATMFAIGFFATFLASAGVMDMMLMMKHRAKLQSLADTAALFSLNHNGPLAEKEEVFFEYLENVNQFHDGLINMEKSSLTFEEKDDVLSISATLSSPIDFIVLQNLSNFSEVTAETEAEIGIQDIEVSLVIDISSSMAGARITEAKKSAKVFVEQLLENQNSDGETSIALIPFGGTVRLPEGMNYLLETPSEGLDEFSEYWLDGEWNQCIELDVQDVKDGIKTDKTYKAIVDFYSWNKNNPWCPTKGNEFVPLTNDVEVLKNSIDDLTLSDGTGSDHGMMWAYENLNSYWKNTLPGGLNNTPAEQDEKTKKIIVFMTDGGITAQHYVRDQDKFGSLPFDSKKRQRISRNNALSAFYSVCDKAKSNDIEIYTIGYLLTNQNRKNELINCASTSSNYLDANSGNLSGIFSSVANSIAPLRLSN